MEGTNCCKCDVKTWLLSGFVVAILYFGLDMFFHGYCMTRLYQENAQYFRSMEEMKALTWWGYGGYLLFGLLFSAVYSKGYEEGKSKAGQGFRFGLLMGLLFWGAHLLLSYPHFPWPDTIYLSWFGIGVAEYVILGFILGMLYRPKPKTL